MKLFYYITSLLICQVLFSSFFKFFRDVRCRFLCSNSFIISLLFQFVKYFFHFFLFQIFFSVIPRLPLSCVSLPIISLPNKFVNTFSGTFFRSRQLLFPESRQASFSSPYLCSLVRQLYYYITFFVTCQGKFLEILSMIFGYFVYTFFSYTFRILPLLLS